MVYGIIDIAHVFNLEEYHVVREYNDTTSPTQCTYVIVRSQEASAYFHVMAKTPPYNNTKSSIRTWTWKDATCDITVNSSVVLCKGNFKRDRPFVDESCRSYTRRGIIFVCVSGTWALFVSIVLLCRPWQNNRVQNDDDPYIVHVNVIADISQTPPTLTAQEPSQQRHIDMKVACVNNMHHTTLREKLNIGVLHAHSHNSLQQHVVLIVNP